MSDEYSLHKRPEIILEGACQLVDNPNVHQFSNLKGKSPNSCVLIEEIHRKPSQHLISR